MSMLCFTSCHAAPEWSRIDNCRFNSKFTQTMTRRSKQSFCVCVCVCVQAVRLSDHRRRLYFSGLSSEIQPLPSERAGPELQSSRRLRSEAAVGGTRGSRLETEHSRVWTDNKSSHTVPLSHWQAENCWFTIWTSSTADNIRQYQTELLIYLSSEAAAVRHVEILSLA